MIRKLICIATLTAVTSLPADIVTLQLNDGSQVQADTDNMLPGGIFAVKNPDGSITKIHRSDVRFFKFPENKNLPARPAAVAAQPPPATQPLTQATATSQALAQPTNPATANQPPAAKLSTAQQLDTPEARAQFAQIRDSFLAQYQSVGDTQPAIDMANALYEKMASGQMTEAELAALGQTTMAKVDKYKEERAKLPQFEGSISQLSSILSKQ